MYTKANGTSYTTASASLIEHVIQESRQLQEYRNGKCVNVTGHGLTIAAVSAAARFGVSVALETAGSPSPYPAALTPVSLANSYEDLPSVTAAEGARPPAGAHARVTASRRALDAKIASGESIYGVSTGFGGSADTRTTETHLLGLALLQHQHAGVLPVPQASPVHGGSTPLTLLDPLASTSMPEAWVRAAMLIRANSLVRGHSAVRWELIERVVDLLNRNITPLVPLRGSISASGDLSPLSYIASTIIGNPSVRVYSGPAADRKLASAPQALSAHGLAPLTLLPKEHLGVLNGTAFSAGLAALALSECALLSVLALVCTAMDVEAMRGNAGSFDAFIHEVCRSHPGQVEAARAIRVLLEGSGFARSEMEEGQVTVEEDAGELRQDRYPLRTAAQWLGPQIEDVMASIKTIELECNSTTDNPLLDTAGRVHHGGNFQAMAVTNAMEKTRLAMHATGKLLFAQMAELLNPAMNRGLPPSLAATDPSLNYHGKGIDIASAAYVSELGWLASPVSTHVQSAELHNQAVNSLALISARATVDAVQILTQLIASHLYLLCQALDLRALQFDFEEGLDAIMAEELPVHLPQKEALLAQLTRDLRAALDATSSMDAGPRMVRVSATLTTPLFDHHAGHSEIVGFRVRLAARGAELLTRLRAEYLQGTRSATCRLARTRPMYTFVREELGVKMHGAENLAMFEMGLGVEDVTVGENVSRIYEAIRDGQMRGVVERLLE